MGLRDYANNIHTKYQNKYPNRGAWNSFKKDCVIVCFDKYVGYPLYTDRFFMFLEKLNELSKEEATELMWEAGISNHEIIEILNT